MEEKELTELVLEKTEEAYATINCLADEDGEAEGYFHELHNFYTHPQNREVYLGDFKNFYLRDIEESIVDNGRRLEIYDWGEKRLKRTYIADTVFGLGFLGGAIFFNWILAIPVALCVWNFNRTYDKLEELKKERERVLSLLEEDEDKKKEIEGTNLLEKVLDENKEKIMEYYKSAMEDKAI